MKWNVMPLTAMAAAVLFTAACNNNDDDNNAINSTDRDYVTKAALSNTAEIKVGNIAALKATDPSIKSFAQMMIMHHNIAQDSLQQIAGSLGLYAPDSADAAHMAMAAMLDAMPAGRAFDSAYINGQVTDHQATLSLFQTEAASGSNQDVKDYEKQYEDVIQMHLMMSDSLAAPY